MVPEIQAGMITNSGRSRLAFGPLGRALNEEEEPPMRVHVGDLNLHVLDAGQGEPLVFVHGFPLDHRMWERQIEAFSKTHRVIAPDLRGFGQSDRFAGTATMELFADDLAAVLDELGVREPVTLCGLSMGGYVAWQFARKRPSRLRALVACDTKATPDAPEAVQTRHDTAAKVLDEGQQVVADSMPAKLLAPETFDTQPELVERVKRMMLDASREGIAAALRGMAERPDMTAALAGLGVPTLVVVGEHDQVTPPDVMRKLAGALPQSEFVAVPRAGHLAPLEQPEFVNDALRRFLA
jgi:3-oxoadipate enol-lactonase